MIKRLNKILDKNQIKKSYILFFLMFLASGLEFLSIGLIFPIISLFFNAEIPQFFEKFKNLIPFLNKDNLLVQILIIFTFLFSFRTIILIYILWYEQSFIATFKEEYSSKLFNNYLKQNYSFFEGRNSSDFIRNLITELDSVVNYILYSFRSILDSLTILFLSSLMIIVDFSYSLKGISVFTILVILYFQLIRPHLKKWAKERFESESKRIQFIREGLSTVKDLKLLERDAFIFEKFKLYNMNLRNISIKVGFINQLPRFIIELALVLVATYFFLNLYLSNDLNKNLAALSLSLAALIRIMPSLNRLVNSLQIIKYASYSVDKLSEEMIKIKRNLIKEKLPNKIKINFKDSIVADVKCFEYKNKSTFQIKNLFLKIKKNSRIGIIGASGSGKTTIVEILLGILKDKNSSVKIDNIPIEEISNRHELIGYVPQKVFILDDTIKNNILFGLDPKKFNDEKIFEVINKTNLKNLVDRKGNGLQGQISEKGSNLSGGEIQRIGIARAMIYDPPIIFFDEATSSLDTFTERKILEEINAFKDKTFIFVAHRLGTLKETDKIYLIEKGQVTQEGNYNKFLNQI